MIRNGLQYQFDMYPELGEAFLLYRPAEPFTVDGIEYPDDPDLYCARPMIEIFGDGDGLASEYCQVWGER